MASLKHIRDGVHTTQLYLEHTLKFSKDLRVRDCLSGLVILDHGRLLIDLLCEILLSELLGETSLRDNLADSWRNLWGRCDLVFTVEFRNTLVIRP